MASSSSIPELYILWHARCAVGEGVAKKIYEWLRPGNGLGPQVFYRSLPAPEASPGGLPPPLPGEARLALPQMRTPRTANLQIVLPLIDENMVADPAWRFWLSQLASPGSIPRRVFPVALDSTAFNMPAPVRELNFLRPTGTLELALAPTDKALRSLLKQLTEALCRVLLGEADAGQVPVSAVPKIKIFLSHAKQDGAPPARRIRDYIYSQTQIAAFYDENDIPLGSAFARVLETDLQYNQTAALIAVRSARYASRPWCRRELSMFRRPLREPRQSNHWQLNPVLVVDAIENGASTSGVPEFGNAPIIRWAPEIAEQEEQIVTTVLRDALLGAVHAAIGHKIAERSNCIVINWLPDPTSLLHVLGNYPPGQDFELHYPGHGLSGLELDIMYEMFPHLELHSFEEFLQ
jgi:hypothetical protein